MRCILKIPEICYFTDATKLILIINTGLAQSNVFVSSTAAVRLSSTADIRMSRLKKQYLSRPAAVRLVHQPYVSSISRTSRPAAERLAQQPSAWQSSRRGTARGVARVIRAALPWAGCRARRGRPPRGEALGGARVTGAALPRTERLTRVARRGRCRLGVGRRASPLASPGWRPAGSVPSTRHGRTSVGQCASSLASYRRCLAAMMPSSPRPSTAWDGAWRRSRHQNGTPRAGWRARHGRPRRETSRRRFMLHILHLLTICHLTFYCAINLATYTAYSVD